ncbi:MAG: UxaA family hydrolase [Candidatus Sigynarchaeota archaeon]
MESSTELEHAHGREYMERKFLIMDPKDNVATALANLVKGETVKIDDVLTITINKNIDMGHKFALKLIKKDELVIKYGEVIGQAKRDIQPGDWVHSNIRSPYMKVAGKDAE